MAEFDIAKFNELIREYYKFRSEHPYHYLDWRTNGENAKKCKNILDNLAVQLKILVGEFVADVKFDIRVSKGASYFPKSPWIGVMFEGEKAKNGVYPVFSFNEEDRGFLVGCVDSIANPQPNFQKYCFTSDEIRKLGSPISYDEHLAKNAKWFPAESDVKREELSEAFRNAIEIRNQYRQGEKNISVGSLDWCKVVQVKDVYGWLSFIRSMNQRNADGSDKHWVFRGQANADWSLKSSLERMIDYGENDRISDDYEEQIRVKERASVAEFRRELSKESDYRTHKDIDLLALMQHYGSKTRLIDFTKSPLIALYMAVDSYDRLVSESKQVKTDDDSVSSSPNPGLAVWAINLNVMHSDAHDKRCDWTNFVTKASQLANLVICGKELKDRSPGTEVLPVFPQIGNPRLSAQEGLFLMARKLLTPLEDSIRRTIVDTDGYDSALYSPCSLSSALQPDHYDRCYAYKFEFGREVIEQIRDMLNNLCITSKIAYPDLEGLAKSVTPII